ncbi:hypothetical protein [Peribacillus sp. SCS-155]|uniref:hypothetical protein n=1 Tax=Peribacillus sedimenti TaxID=3115297 RepID=UPI003905E037
MLLNDIIGRINESIEELDLVTARKYMEDNLSILNENKRLLNKNARELLDFLSNRTEKPLTRQELASINAINSYASKFDLRGIKLFIKDNAQLFLREDVIHYLNSDAKIILEGMGAINKKSQ